MTEIRAVVFFHKTHFHCSLNCWFLLVEVQMEFLHKVVSTRPDGKHMHIANISEPHTWFPRGSMSLGHVFQRLP